MTKTSALFKHISSVYQIMEKDSAIEGVENKQLRIYRGKVTELYAELGISSAYYAKVFRTLKDMGCVTQLHRGARDSPSVFVLHYPPNEAEFQQRDTERLTNRVDYATLSQRVDDIARQMGGVDVQEVIGDHEKRLQKLEKERQEK